MKYTIYSKNKKTKLSISIKRNNPIEHMGFGITFMRGSLLKVTKSWWLDIYLIFGKISFHYFSVDKKKKHM